MRPPYARPFSRRRFLGGLTLVGTAGLLGLYPRPTAAETPQVRLIRSPDIYLAPLYMAEELLRGEGFTDVQYVQGTGGQDDIRLAATGATDFIGGFVGRHLAGLDAGDPIVILSGLHIGCFELFGNQRVGSIRDLKGKRVAVTRLTSGRHIFRSVMAGHVGLDPWKTITWVTDPAATSMQLFAEGTDWRFRWSRGRGTGVKGNPRLPQVRDPLSPPLLVGQGAWDEKGARQPPGPLAAGRGQFDVVTREPQGRLYWRLVFWMCASSATRFRARDSRRRSRSRVACMAAGEP